MIQTSPTLRILVAVEPVDFRRGIDGLAAICRQQLARDPMNGWAFVFRNRTGTAVKILLYDGQGFWLCHKRLSAGHYGWWPARRRTAPAGSCRVTSCTCCFRAAIPRPQRGAPLWRPVCATQ